MSNFNPGQQRGFCSLHKTTRNKSDLIEAGDGTFRCLPNNECREIEHQICRLHQVKRPVYQLQQVEPGVFQCSSDRPCREARMGMSAHSGGGEGGERSRGGYHHRGGFRGRGRGFADAGGDDQQHYRGGRGFRGGRGDFGGGRGRGFNNKSHLTFFGANKNTMMNSDAEFAASGIVVAEGAFNRGGGPRPGGVTYYGGRGGGHRGRGAPRGGGGISDHMQRAKKLLGEGGAGNDDDANEEDREAARDEIYERFNNQGASGFFGNSDSSRQQRNFENTDEEDDEAKQRQQKLMLAMMLANSQQQNQNSANAEVWCSRHGRRIQFATADSLDGGMTFICHDATECLMAPLDDPKTLAAKGCAELRCARHNRVRGAKWLVVSGDPRMKGFVCKLPHVCRRVGEAVVNADE